MYAWTYVPLSIITEYTEQVDSNTMILARIREFPGSNLGRDTGYLD
jgi:hypothetical protein